ncbi:MAG: ABC transporter permease [Spirochaetaceae bacterium]|nr:MAG: ABC transporter permease [Spirochaetaceae bacterium]
MGGVALLLPFIEFKPNRVAEGEAFHLWSIGLTWEPWLLAAIVLTALLLGLSGEGPRVRAGKVAVGIALFAATLPAALRAGLILVTDQTPFGRVGPVSGFWVLVLATFLIVEGSLRTARYSPLLKGAIRALPPTIVILALATGGLDSFAMVQEYVNRADRFSQELVTHLRLAAGAVLAAVTAGVPLGLLAWKRRAFERPVFAAVNTIQTVPSLALFGLMIAPLALLSRQFPLLRAMGVQGIGTAPALIALTLYALLPIVRNTYTSLSVIPDAVIEAGSGMGMNRYQLLRLVEAPLSIPIILSGIRTSVVQAIGNTTVAALIGAGGLGVFVFQGLGQAAPDLIVMGVIPIIVLAVLVDRGLAVLIALVTPAGLRKDPP